MKKKIIFTILAELIWKLTILIRFQKMARTWREITRKTDFEEVLELSNSRPQAVLITCKLFSKKVVE